MANVRHGERRTDDRRVGRIGELGSGRAEQDEESELTNASYVRPRRAAPSKKMRTQEAPRDENTASQHNEPRQEAAQPKTQHPRPPAKDQAEASHTDHLPGGTNPAA